MSNISLKRLMHDYKNMSADLLAEKGIYTKVNDENIYEAYALILGTSDTPYDSGFYFFKFNFCKKYPLVPPSVKFMTLNNEVRFNPNLYVEGKVCLSILGTWSGPSWTSCMNFETILVSLQTVLNDNPIRNEPGYEETTGDITTSYNNILSYYNLKVAVLQMLESPPLGFEYFLPIMIDNFYKRYDIYKNIITNVLLPLDSKVLYFKVYRMKTLANVTKLAKRLEDFYNSNKSTTENNLVIQDVVTDEVISKNVKKRKCPTESAKNYEIGTIKTGLDDKLWEVKEYKNGRRWVLYKDSLVVD